MDILGTLAFREFQDTLVIQETIRVPLGTVVIQDILEFQDTHDLAEFQDTLDQEYQGTLDFQVQMVPQEQVDSLAIQE